MSKEEGEEDRSSPSLPSHYERCSLSVAQVAELYEKMDWADRSELFHWAVDVASSSAAAAAKRTSASSAAVLATSTPIFRMVGGGEESGSGGDPTTSWWVATVDTGRWVRFRFRALVFRTLPALPAADPLFQLAARLFQRLAVPLCLLAARYETVADGALHLLALSVPLDHVVHYVESHARQDQMERGDNNKDKAKVGEMEELRRMLLKTPASSSSQGGEEADMVEYATIDPKVRQEIERLRALWNHPDLYRSFSHAILRIRSDFDPPVCLLYSLVDRDFVVVVFRDMAFVDDEFHRSIPALRGKRFLSWPIRDHRQTANPPETRCGNPSCEKVSRRECADPRWRETWERHRGPRFQQARAMVKERAQRRWREEIEPRMFAEVEERWREAMRKRNRSDGSDTGEGVGEGEEEDANEEGSKLREDIIAELTGKYEAEMDAHERGIVEEVLGELFTTLRPCSACRSVSYCGTDCQRADWPSHKKLCPFLKSD